MCPTCQHMSGEDLCPICLEPLVPHRTFTHSRTRFDTLALHAYLSACPGAPNPITRAAFGEDDIRRLNQEAVALQPDIVPLLHGHRAKRARTRRAEVAHMVAWLEAECRECVCAMLEGRLDAAKAAKTLAGARSRTIRLSYEAWVGVAGALAGFITNQPQGDLHKEALRVLRQINEVPPRRSARIASGLVNVLDDVKADELLSSHSSDETWYTEHASEGSEGSGTTVES